MNKAWGEMVILTHCLVFYCIFLLGSYNAYRICLLPPSQNLMGLFKPYSFV